MNFKRTISDNWKLIGVFLLTFLVFFPMFRNELLNWDDGRYITNNLLIRQLSFKQVIVYFTQYFDGHYHPLTLLSLAIDYKISGENPLAFQITSMILHLLNVYLVYYFVKTLLKNKNWALIVAVLFGIHTMQVESVVWMSERKNLLYTAFFFGSLICYLRYIEKNNIKIYLLSILLFIFSALSKVMAISLLPTLFIIDIYYKRNFKSKAVCLDKIPFLVIGFVFGLIAIWAQNTTWGAYDKPPFNFIERIPIAAYSFTQYFLKLIVPFKLSAFYPYPDKINGTLPWYLWLWLIPAIIYLIALIKTFRQRGVEFFALAFFGANIFLLIKLFDIPIGDNLLGDRYVYIPSVGLFLLVPYYFSKLKKAQPIKVAKVGITIYFIFLSVFTFSRTKVWKDDFTLFNDVIQKYPNVSLAYNNRGMGYNERGEFKNALADFNKAIQLKPQSKNAYLNRGALYAKTGEINNALKDFNRVILMNPKDTVAYLNRGIAFAQIENWEKAINDYTRAIELCPDYYLIYANRGVALGSAGEYNRALTDFNKTIDLMPNYPNVYFNRANLWAQQNSFSNAIIDYSKAIELNPEYTRAIINRGQSYFTINDFDKAISDFSMAIKRSPQNASLYYKRGLCYLQLNTKAEAKKDFIMAQKLGLNINSEQINNLINKELNR